MSNVLKMGTNNKVLSVLEVLKGIYEESHSGIFMGGTLVSNGFVLNRGNYGLFKGYFDSGSSTLRKKYTEEEEYWWCKCYVKHKTKNHAYFKECMRVVVSGHKKNN